METDKTAFQKSIDDSLEDVDKICRICLLLRDVSPLSKCKYYDTFVILQRFWGETARLAKKLFPPNICPDCLCELQMVNSFITKLESSTEILNRVFEQEMDSLRNRYEEFNDTENVKRSEEKVELESEVDNKDNEIEVIEDDTEEIIIIEGADDASNKEAYQTDENSEESKEFMKMKCTICTLTFKYYRNWQRHLQLHEQINKKMSRQKKKYRYHFSSVKYENVEYTAGKFLKMPTKKIKEERALITHLSTHNNYNYQCELCGRVYTDNILLEKHQEAVHNEQEKTSLKLKSSNKNKTTRGQYVCKYCGKECSVKSNLSRHIEVIHERSKRFICNVCGEKFSVKNSLKYHMYIHTNEKPYECNICNKSFRQPNALKRHNNTRHVKEKNFECDICLKKLKSNFTLEKHRLRHMSC